MVSDKREEILFFLREYRNLWWEKLANPAKEDAEIVLRFESFVKNNLDCFERSNLQGHVTGSALIVDEKLEKVLLTHHKKLNLWLQLGGHADGNPHPQEVALMEGKEESGLENLRLFSPPPFVFDLDIHAIPERKTEPEHLHYDVRYLVIAPEPDRIVVSHESHDLRWFALEEAYKVANQLSMHRQFDKVRFLKTRSLPCTV